MAWLGKFRPQIFLAIAVLGVLAYFGATNGHPEIATGTIGGIIALGMNIHHGTLILRLIMLRQQLQLMKVIYQTLHHGL